MRRCNPIWFSVRRIGHNVWAWPDKIYIPCPVRVKNRFRVQALESRMSQAELGLVIIDAAMNQPRWLDRVIRNYFETECGIMARKVWVRVTLEKDVVDRLTDRAWRARLSRARLLHRLTEFGLRMYDRGGFELMDSVEAQQGT